MNINAQGKRACCGCMVCAIVCPTSCISIQRDQDGYPVAVADGDFCVDCGKCVDVCYKFQERSTPPPALKSYVGYNLDESIRFSSSSGGVASALVLTALEEGYTVVGAEMNYDTMRVEHVFITDSGEIGRIMGSKYFPSYTLDAFSALQDVDKALVIATPCQISALRKAYKSKNFVYADLKCFGPMGYLALEKYVRYLEGINPSGIKSLNFRGKDISWKAWGPRVEFKDGGVYAKTSYKDLLGRIFNVYGCVHQTCHSCVYFKNASEADIRLEDAWHKMTLVTSDSWKRGLSQITAFTEKGLDFVSKASSRLKLAETTPSVVIAKRKTAPEKLLAMFRDKDVSLQEIAREYDRSQPVKRRVMNRLEYYLTLNRPLYLLVYRAFHLLKRMKVFH
ncbi:Coenzyme F420 hydrogenase/dehydrogenase, beta subunit C-terminal domain [Pseudodesulfovibrio thermohalotolerans]|uniref:Coenzyme F420 hydrogenase/dehydrogenase, beta subunit C-terminal domain n=1 Tax=Pseudodesulfovibrio thermohalotolerans TaxID=2880651 RepID=UPI0024411ED7|nr:Coenzyme F420 hydrogenase/dehydrogenase, beta subunit C-terminal domain [Pseudodesulfovibrio thermohalotolerans]WFS62732.1 Coenzyme F420 hydrogenase/dehydrogenase, beta subunit C-terminal domain [Pseudodesulfovibrio thermohalotolerans]